MRQTKYLLTPHLNEIELDFVLNVKQSRVTYICHLIHTCFSF